MAEEQLSIWDRQVRIDSERISDHLVEIQLLIFVNDFPASETRSLETSSLIVAHDCAMCCDVFEK
jgi:hypothetical protein